MTATTAQVVCAGRAARWVVPTEPSGKLSLRMPSQDEIAAVLGDLERGYGLLIDLLRERGGVVPVLICPRAGVPFDRDEEAVSVMLAEYALEEMDQWACPACGGPLEVRDV